MVLVAGVWDVMSNAECCHTVRALLATGETDVGLICEELLDLSLEAGSTDNITAAIVALPGAKVGEIEGDGLRAQRAAREEARQKKNARDESECNAGVESRGDSTSADRLRRFLEEEAEADEDEEGRVSRRLSRRRRSLQARGAKSRSSTLSGSGQAKMDGASSGRALPANQGGAGPIIVFDWDCTITATHMFKVLSGWEGYCEPFSDWCVEQGIDDPLRIPVRESICERMEFGGGAAGLAALKHVFVTFFMGGEERMAQVKAALTTLKHTHGCRLCVLTRGDTASLRIVFDKVLDESWAELFEGGWIANTFNDYFTCSGSGALSAITPGLTSIGREGDGSKESIIEAVFPFTEEFVMLVDDSISRSSMLAATSAPGNRGGTISLLDLPMEKDGLDARSIKLLLSLVGGDGGLAELSKAQARSKDRLLAGAAAAAGASGAKTTIATVSTAAMKAAAKSRRARGAHGVLSPVEHRPRAKRRKNGRARRVVLESFRDEDADLQLDFL